MHVHSHSQRLQSSHPVWRIITVIELSEDMSIGQDQSRQHSDRCLLKFGNGDLQIAELPDSIHNSPEYTYNIQDDSGIAIRESIRHSVKKKFSDTIRNIHAPEQQWIFGKQKGQYKHQTTAQLIMLMPSVRKNYYMEKQHSIQC